MIPISEPVLGKNAEKYLKECARAGWVSSQGAFVNRFEKMFASFCGVKYAVAVNSGTAAIHLALTALNIGPGDEVIVPAYTMIATVLPVIYVGAKPVLVDVEEKTGNIDPDLVKKKISTNTKAIIAVHVNGHPANMEKLLQFGVPVVEDAAEAHGSQVKVNGLWRKTGSVGKVGCFSFYANKIITSGEGGMVTTNSKRLAERIMALRNLSRSKDRHFYHREVAFAYRMSNLQAAVGVAGMEEATKLLARKRRVGELYERLLKKVPGIELPVEKEYAKRLYWHYEIKVKNRDEMAKELERAGIETRLAFVPMNKQPAFRKRGLFLRDTYPVAEEISKKLLSLPTGLALTDKEVKYVCEKIIHNLG